MDKKNKADLQPNSQNQNVMHNLMLRDCGLLTNHQFNTKEFEKIAERNLIRKELKETKCDLPGTPKTTFLMVFSPDGTKVASTHGNHNIYITDVCTGRNIKILSGHPRTPWCIAFHPTSNKILASGCLGGQVRVWDLSGGSAVWNSRSQIASLAFHPVERLIAIASYNEIHFWDWGHKEPFTSVSTKSTAEKVRYVAFDKMGSKLITGIANPLGFYRSTGRNLQDIKRHFEIVRRRAQSYFGETSNLDETENPSSNSSNNNNSENNLENESTSQNMTFARVTPRIVVPHVLVEVVRHQDRNNTSPTISIDTSRTEPRVDNSVGENEEERPGSIFRNLFEASQVDGNINNSSNREENAAATNFLICLSASNTADKITTNFRTYIHELNNDLNIIVQFLRGICCLHREHDDDFIRCNLTFISSKFYMFSNGIQLVQKWLTRLQLQDQQMIRIEQRLYLYRQNIQRNFRSVPPNESRNLQFHRIQDISQLLESISARLNRFRLGIRDIIIRDNNQNRENNHTLNQNQLNVLQQRMMSSIIGEESTINADTQENSDSVGDEQTNQTNDPQTSTLRPDIRRQLDRNDDNDDDQPRATKRRLNSDSDTNVRHAEGFSETCMENDEHTNVIYQSHPFQFSGSSRSAFQPIRASLLHRINRVIDDLGHFPHMNQPLSMIDLRRWVRDSFIRMRARQREVQDQISSDFQMLEMYLNKLRTTPIRPSSRHSERIDYLNRPVLRACRSVFAERGESFLSNAQPTTSNSESHTEPARNFKKTLLEIYVRQAQERGTNTDILQPQPSTSRGSTSTMPYHGNRISQSQPSTSTTSSTASINSMSTNSVNDSEPSTSSSSNTIDLGEMAISQSELVDDAKRIRRMIFRAIYPDANQNIDENDSSSDSSDNDSHESSSSSDRSDNDSHEPSTSTSQCNNTTTTVDSMTNKDATTSNNNSSRDTNENTNNADFASAQDRINSLYRSFRAFLARQHTHTNTFYASTVSNVQNLNRFDAIEFVLLQIKRMSDFLVDVVTNTVGSETEKSNDVIRKFVKLLTRSCHEFILLRRDIENRGGPTSRAREADSDINLNKLIKLTCNIKKRRDSILKSVLALLNVLHNTHTYFENLARPLKLGETLRNVFNSTIRNIVIHPTNPESPSAFTASSSNNGTENDNLLTNNTRNESPLSAEIQSIFERIQNNETNNSNDATQRIPNRNRTSFYPNNESDNSEDEEGYHARRCNRLLLINRINRIANMHHAVFNNSLRRQMILQHYERVLRSEVPSNNAHNNDDSSSSRRIFSRSRLNSFRSDSATSLATRRHLFGGWRNLSRGALSRFHNIYSQRNSNLGNNEELRNDVRNLANEVYQTTSHFLNRFRTQEYLGPGRSRQENSNGQQDPEYANDYIEMFRDHQLGIPFNGLEFLSYRIQAWDFSSIPDIQDPEKNVIVPECKIHNDASIDISSDGTLLATILPRHRTMAAIGLYSLEWDTLGKRVYSMHMRETIISVSISPAKKHLLVGLATRRILADTSAMAFIYELVEPAERDRSRVSYSNNLRLGNMQLLRRIYQAVEDSSPNQMSLNCIRWAPQPGQGIVYATNTGLLNMLR